jgi:hypothetical protein
VAAHGETSRMHLLHFTLFISPFRVLRVTAGVLASSVHQLC